LNNLGNDIQPSLGQFLGNSIIQNNSNFDSSLNQIFSDFPTQKPLRRNYQLDNENKQHYGTIISEIPNHRTDYINVTLEFEDRPNSKTLFKNKNITYN